VAADFAPAAIGLMANYTVQGAGEIPADFDYFSLKPWTDDFDSPTQNPSWEWINQESDYWSLADRPGFMRIMQLSGSPEKNLLKQRNAPTGDYEVITRVQFEPSHTFQKAGIVISPGGIYDANAVYLFRGGCYDPGPVFCNDDAIYFENWTPSEMLMQSLYPWSHTDTYLRLVKRGLTYTGYASTDGANWAEVGSWTVTWTGGTPGLAAHNPVEDPAGIIPADFDFFVLNTLPDRVFLPIILR
jgi:Beta xylosidase C-terminal Concanavalin A-like domain